VEDDLVGQFGFAASIDEKEEDPAQGADSDDDHEIDGKSVESSAGSGDMKDEPNQKEEGILSHDDHEVDERSSLLLQLEHDRPDQQGGDAEEEDDQDGETCSLPHLGPGVCLSSHWRVGGCPVGVESDLIDPV